MFSPFGSEKKITGELCWMAKIIRTVWSAITTVLVGVAVLLAMALVGVRIFGFEIFTVLSGSMEPVLHTGSVIYVKEADTNELAAGDIITFHLGGGTIATHRIIEVVEDSGSVKFRTKGDANNVEDAGLVAPEDVIGSPKFTIPLLGFVVGYIQEPPGTYVAVSAAALILLFVLLPDLILPPEEPKKKRKKYKHVKRKF